MEMKVQSHRLCLSGRAGHECFMTSIVALVTECLYPGFDK